MDVPIVKSGGVQVYTDSFLMEKDRYSNQTWMVSLFGPGTGLQSIHAALVTSREVKCHMPSGKVLRFYLPSWNVKFHSIVKRVQGQSFRHMVIYPEIASQRSGQSKFILTGFEGTDFPHMLYSFLVKRIEVPIHKSWKQWLWSLFKNEGWMKDLHGYGRLRGFYVDGYSWLDDRIVKAVKSGEIGVSGNGET